MTAAPYKTIELGRYTADLVSSSKGDPFWYYVVQPKGSREIVALGGCKTYEEARAAALEALERFKRAAASGE